MSLKVESIKKLMGWCPNTRAYEARQRTNFESFESDIPDRAKGDSGDQKIPDGSEKQVLELF
jgi:hypothetical protein